MNYIAVTYGYRNSDEPILECFETEKEAIAHLRNTANGYMECGDQPPQIEEWFVAHVTHEIRIKQVPFGDSSPEILPVGIINECDRVREAALAEVRL